MLFSLVIDGRPDPFWLRFPGSYIPEELSLFTMVFSLLKSISVFYPYEYPVPGLLLRDIVEEPPSPAFYLFIISSLYLSMILILEPVVGLSYLFSVRGVLMPLSFYL